MEGTRLGPYQLLAELGSGGMGKVYRAEVTGAVPGLEPGCAVALKVIHAHLLETPGFFKRFLREAEIGKAVEQDNVVRCFDCDAVLHEGVQQNFLVMEYVEGQTLRDLLNELERVPEELCRHIGREIAKGLVAIHEAGVIHRDLKPENVLITEDHVVKVMDLGVARLQDEANRLSQSGAFVGSLEYAPPEQFRGKEVDPRGDLYALGVVLYELSTGRHPYRSDDAASTLRNVMEGGVRQAGEVNPQLSAFFEEVVHALAAKEPGERFSSASVLLGVLEEGEKSEWWQERAKTIRVQTNRPLRRIRIPRETALYGRDDDLARLHALYKKAKKGDGQVLLIEGEAGIGKTRLVDEFVGRLRQEGEDLNFVFGSYPPGGAATASGAFSTAYREQLGAEGLEETLKEYLTVTPVLIPSFAALLRGETTPKDAERLTKDSLQTVFTHATRALAAERPTIVLIDDLHFAPEEGRALFASLGLAVRGHRILLLGTMRRGVPEEWTANVTRLDHAEHASLPRLGPKDLAKLLEDAFHSERLATELGHKIALKCDGNPFFAFEMIRGLKEGQFITQKADGAWVTTQFIEDIQVPSSVLDLVNARVADLTEEERNLLEVASCCGFQFDPELVGEVLGMGPIPALQRLGRVEKRHRLVRSSAATYAFDHHQVQEALYGGLHERLRGRYHAAIGEALEAREGAADKDPKDLDGALCVDLCEHFLEGAQGERGIRYLHAALNHLQLGYLNDQAIHLADRALDVEGLLEDTARVGVLLHQAGRFDLLGRRDEERTALEEAVALADETGENALRSKARRSLGLLMWALSENDAARAAFERSRELARAAGDRELETAATGNLGLVFWALGRHKEAREHHERHRALSREIGDRRGEAIATGNLGLVYRSLGRLAEAREHHERHRAISCEIGDRQGEAIATGNLGVVFSSLGRYPEAREHHDRHRALSRETGDRRGEARATGNLGNVFSNLGRYAEAQEYYEHYRALSREIGDRQGEAIAAGNLGVVFKGLGRLAEARAHNERYRAISREIGYRRGEAIATDNLGALSQDLGRHAEAREHYERCRSLSREIGDRSGEGYALAGLASVAEVQENADEASRLHAEALTLRGELGAKGAVAETLLALGRLEATRGEEESASTHLDEALALARETGSPNTILAATVERARLSDGDVESALAALAEHEGRGGHGDRMNARFRLWQLTEDQTHLSEAHRLLAHLVEHAPEEYRESMLKNVRLNREIMEAWEEHGGEGEA